MVNQQNEVQDYVINTGIDVINENAHTVKSKEEFSHYMENGADNGIYRPQNIDNIKIVQSVNNTSEAPNKNIYEFRYSYNGVEKSLCTVVGKENADEYLTYYVRNYFGDLKNNIKKGVAIEIGVNSVTVKIKEEMQELANDVLVDNIDTIKQDIKDLKERYKGTKQKLSKEDKVIRNKNGKLSPTEENFVKLLRNKVDRDMSELAQIDNKLDAKKKDLEKDRANIDAKNNIEEVWRKMHALKEDQNYIENFIYSGAALANFMINTPTGFEWNPNDVKQAEKIKKYYTDIEEAKQLINNTMIQADMKKIMNDHGESLYDYLNRVSTGQLDPAEQPFVVDPNHINGFNHIIQQQPNLSIITGQKKQEENKQEKITDNNGKEIFADPKAPFENNNTYINTPGYASTKEAFEKGGITGVLDHALKGTKMNAQQREFRGGAAKLAAIGGGIWLGWKFLKGTFDSFFGEEADKKKGMPWMIGGLAAIIGSQAATGRNPRDIVADVVKGGKTTNYLANILNTEETPAAGQNTETQATPEALTYAQGFPAMAQLFNGMKYSEMAPFIEKKGGKLTLNIPLMKQNQRFKTTEMAKVIDFLDANQKKDIVDLALTGMGIDEDALKNNPDKLFNETAADALGRVVEVYKTMEEGGYDIVSNEGLKLVRQYIKTGSPSIDNLVGKDIFEKSDTKITAVLDTNLQNAVLDIPINDKEQLTKSIKIFLESNKTAGLDIIKEAGKTYIKNYDKQTEIDFTSKKIAHGGHEIVCDTYTELIRAATLTNFLKKNFADNSKIKQPFSEGLLSADIKFDEGTRYKPKIDAVTAGKDRQIRGINIVEGKLNKFIPALADNKKTYIQYLNSFDIRQRKVS